MSELIEFKQDGTSVKLNVESGGEAGRSTFPFSFNCANEWSATLLLFHLRERMWDRLKTIREDAYKQGWKEAKAHATKEKYFSSRWQG